ncbi:MAG: hypothetical protein A3H93_09175 [Rhodocyclales bacterium RIFCSPLOWO2_02_FULL_63_24]|nr:MAG: hypothetical protein A3H93_09175 [Rhodocyclales bacterium RIFCSPLOWO2_02_FULL_63_24]
MTDVFDRASEIEEQQRQVALQRQARRAGLAAPCAPGFPFLGQAKTVEDSASHCRVCESLIPVARRRAVPGVQTCITCQTDLERAVS